MLNEYLTALRKEQETQAIGIVRRPGSDHSSYAFGRAVGQQQGLLQAEQILMAMLKSDDDKEKAK